MSRLTLPAVAAIALMAASSTPAQAQVFYSPNYVYPAGYGFGYAPFYGGNSLMLGRGVGFGLNIGRGSNFGYFPNNR
jgi:hypothetical protein